MGRTLRIHTEPHGRDMRDLHLVNMVPVPLPLDSGVGGAVATEVADDAGDLQEVAIQIQDGVSQILVTMRFSQDVIVTTTADTIGVLQS